VSGSTAIVHGGYGGVAASTATSSALVGAPHAASPTSANSPGSTADRTG
jgi:hypothetical protein